MNIRHAAALALVGWYLMIPPAVEEDSNHALHTKPAPLSEWQNFESFDTAKECEEGAKPLVKPMQADVSQQHLSLNDLRLLYARCFATDDPRLK